MNPFSMILNSINGDAYTVEEALIRNTIRLLESRYTDGYDPQSGPPEKYLLQQLTLLFGDDKAVRRIQSRFLGRLNAAFDYPVEVT